MITASLKDQILNLLIDTGMLVSVNIREDYKSYNIDRYTFSEILDQFERLKLIRQKKLLGGIIDISITADAHDFARIGGFTVHEELIKENIKKLNLEIDLLCKELSPKLLDKAQKITSIGQSILSALSLMR